MRAPAWHDRRAARGRVSQAPAPPRRPPSWDSRTLPPSSSQLVRASSLPPFAFPRGNAPAPSWLPLAARPRPVSSTVQKFAEVRGKSVGDGADGYGSRRWKPASEPTRQTLAGQQPPDGGPQDEGCDEQAHNDDAGDPCLRRDTRRAQQLAQSTPPGVTPQRSLQVTHHANPTRNRRVRPAPESARDSRTGFTPDNIAQRVCSRPKFPV
jgi:hypothetical protein